MSHKLSNFDRVVDRFFEQAGSELPVDPVDNQQALNTAANQAAGNPTANEIGLQTSAMHVKQAIAALQDEGVTSAPATAIQALEGIIAELDAAVMGTEAPAAPAAPAPEAPVAPAPEAPPTPVAPSA